MKIIVIHGAPAVGKLTVAEALAKRTGYVILHNHMTTDIAVRFFPFGSPAFYRVIQKMRFTILEEAVKAVFPGIIWTTGLPNAPEISTFYKRLDRFVKKKGGIVHYVHLVCDVEEQKRRVRSASRKKFRKPQSVASVLQNMREIDFTPGHGGESTLRIDNTRLSPQKVAEQIINHFHLNRRS